MQELLNRAANTIDEQAEVIRAQNEWIARAIRLLSAAYQEDSIYITKEFLKGPGV